MRVRARKDSLGMPAMRRESSPKRACRIMLKRYRLRKGRDVNCKPHFEIRGGRTETGDMDCCTHFGILLILDRGKMKLMPERIANPSVAAPISTEVELVLRGREPSGELDACSGDGGVDLRDLKCACAGGGGKEPEGEAWASGTVEEDAVDLGADVRGAISI